MIKENTFPMSLRRMLELLAKVYTWEWSVLF